MVNLKFEGEVDGISGRQLEFVISVLEKRGFKNEIVRVSAVGKADDNYISNVKRFIVEKDGDTFKMIAKLAPTDEARRVQAPHTLFQNEHIMYTHVFPKFTELEKAAHISEHEHLKYCTCYGSLCEAPNEIILLEDLQPLNFVMLDKQESLTDETVKLVLKNFARLHSLSFVLNNQEPDTYEDFKRKLVNYWCSTTVVQRFQAFLNQLEDEVISILDNDTHKNFIKGTISTIPTWRWKSAKLTGILVLLPFSMAMPGLTTFYLDSRQEDHAIECCMLDYQISNHISPVADIEFMISISTDYETRSKHYHEWIDYYYAQLNNCLTNFGLSINVIYPRDKFDDDLKRFAKFSLGLSVLFASLLTRETEDAAKFKEAIQKDMGSEGMLTASKLSNMSESSMIRFKTKLEGLMSSFLEHGYS